jgi:hypothetical protein
MVDALTLCLIICLVPTGVFALIPIVICRGHVPNSSLTANLLTNTCMAFLFYGLYSVSREDRSDFQSGEWLAVGMLLAMVAIFLVFEFRVLNVTLFENDSIAYVPEQMDRHIFDLYTLSEMLIQFQSHPPLIILRRSTPGSAEPPVEEELPYGSWRDVSAVPIRLPKRWLVDITCTLDYVVPGDLGATITRAEADARAASPELEVSTEIVTPGFAGRLFATTRGALPGFVSFMMSDVGHNWRRVLMFIGYHSLLEMIWLIMRSEAEITFGKELSLATEWEPAGQTALVDYHAWPIVE